MIDNSQSPGPKKLDALSARIKQAQEANKAPDAPDRGKQTAMGMAFRLSVEMVSGLLVGGVMGWWLDRWLETKPWMMLCFFFLGAAAGMLNVYRAAMSMQKSAEEEQNGERPD
ncbi:MAG: phosphoribosylaminoimidazolecarboxamide formyltransferase [Kordiimonas sp.]|nr:phosphoribosylaminoimidazolecarboxamide formyltransferase [Kordiimonas sp.]|tara:strand:- start:3069 stop:3407 length:339 start_codon:yes stop_codon:yes gene_type:complete